MSKILITGGSGFLGRHLALRFKDANEVVLASRNNKNNKYAEGVSGCTCLPLDITNIESVRDVMTEVQPDIIIHAAATKFVDLSEKYPMECVDVNVVGSQNVARVAIDKSVDYVLGVSTDKASPPVRNIYGMSKSMMERMFCSMDGKSDTKFACVRYGNVAWSTGSVLPIWNSMILKDNLIQTTGPKMRRYFFTINEAVELVATGIEYKDMIHGKVLSREMKSAMMEDVIRVWINETGGKYKVIDERPGDRLDEYLIGIEEMPYTVEKTLKGIKHYIITFNERTENPVTEEVSSKTATRLTDDEILKLINNEPKL